MGGGQSQAEKENQERKREEQERKREEREKREKEKQEKREKEEQEREREREEKEKQEKFEENFKSLKQTLNKDKFICFDDLLESKLFTEYQLSDIREKFKDVDPKNVYIISSVKVPNKMRDVLEKMATAELCYSCSGRIQSKKIDLFMFNFNEYYGIVACFPNRDDFIKLLNDYGTLYDDLKRVDEILHNLPYEDLLFTKFVRPFFECSYTSCLDMDVIAHDDIRGYQLMVGFEKISKKLPPRFVTNTKENPKTIFLTRIQAQKFICMQVDEKEHLRLKKEYIAQHISAIANGPPETSSTGVIADPVNTERTEIEGQNDQIEGDPN